jgi:hypothetical protein
MGVFESIMGAKKDKGVSSEEEEAPESGPVAPKTGYRALLKESAEDGDWEAFADAVAGLCKQSTK